MVRPVAVKPDMDSKNPSNPDRYPDIEKGREPIKVSSSHPKAATLRASS